MDKEKNVFGKYVEKILTNFAISLIAVSLVGWVVGEEARVEGIMSLAGVGIPYTGMLQLLLFSVLMTIVSQLLVRLTKKILLLWYIVLQLITTYIMTIVFIIVFRWFPIELGEAWIAFTIAFFIITGVLAMTMFIATKLEDRKYQKQLSEYKASYRGGDIDDSNE